MSNTVAVLETVDAEAEIEPQSKARRRLERGLTTVEYAIGLLAAAAAALVLLRIFNDHTFYEVAFKWVVDVFNTISTGSGKGILGMIGKVFGGS